MHFFDCAASQAAPTMHELPLTRGFFDKVHMLRDSHFRLALTALVSSVALAACSPKPPEEALASAKAYLAKNELPAAVVELKNVLAADPAQGEARFLLGRSLLQMEDPKAAALELVRARDAQVPDDQVVPALAQAWLAAGEPRKVLELERQGQPQLPEAVARWKTAVAQAHAAVGNPKLAQTALAEALAALPNHAPALNFRAQLLANSGDFAAALSALEALLVGTPKDAEAWLLKGQLLESWKKDDAAAAAAFRSALAAEPRHLPAAAALLALLLKQNDLAAARTQLEILKTVRPRHAQTQYFEARLASAQGDIKTAYEIGQRLVGLFPNDPQVLHLAGITALQHNQLEQAEQQLGKLVQLAPDFAPGRQALARAYLNAGKPERTLATLQPLLEGPSPEARTLAMAANAQLLAGDESSAEKLFQRAALLKHSGSRTELALGAFGRGDTAVGLGQLEAIASSDKSPVADLALISAKLGKGDLDGALKAIDRLAQKQPGEVQALHLKAQVLARRNDIAGARAAYNQALAIHAKFFAAIDGLAALDLRENKPEQARARLEEFLAQEPGSAAAMVALAAVAEETGKPKTEVADFLGKAVTLSPFDPVLRRRLVNYQINKADTKLALTAAQEAVRALPENLDVLDLLAAAQFASGDTAQALVSYSKRVALSPKSAEGYLGLAKAYLNANDDASADQAMRSAMGLAPDSPEVAQRAAALYVLKGRYDEALKIAQTLKARKDHAAPADELLGDIESSRQRWPAAAAAYRAAMKAQPNTGLAQRLHGALMAFDKPAAQALSAQWTREHPQDVPFLFYVGGVAAKAQDHATAERAFQQILKIHPSNALALNNLAWSTQALKKPGALALAERANALLPNLPVMMDTWAWLLAENNEVAQALRMQERVVSLAPEAPGFRLTLAKIQIKAGNKTSARQELDRLRGLGERFDGQREVTSLLATL